MSPQRRASAEVDSGLGPPYDTCGSHVRARASVDSELGDRSCTRRGSLARARLGLATCALWVLASAHAPAYASSPDVHFHSAADGGETAPTDDASTGVGSPIHADAANAEPAADSGKLSRDRSPGPALSLSDELTLGVFEASGTRAAFIADQLDLDVELTDAWAVQADAALTHFIASSQRTAASMSSFGLGATWSPLDPLELGVHVHAAPPLVFRDDSDDPSDPGRLESRMSAVGGEVSAQTAIELRAALALQLGATLGLTRYALRERFFTPNSRTAADDLREQLWQVHASLTCSLRLREHSELALTGSYAAYYGAPSGELTPLLVGGVPFEPVRYGVRPSFTQRIGAFELAVHGQYAGYAAALGHSWNAGLDARWSANDTLSLAAATELTRATYTDGLGFALYQASLAVTLSL